MRFILLHFSAAVFHDTANALWQELISKEEEKKQNKAVLTVAKHQKF